MVTFQLLKIETFLNYIVQVVLQGFLKQYRSTVIHIITCCICSFAPETNIEQNGHQEN